MSILRALLSRFGDGGSCCLSALQDVSLGRKCHAAKGSCQSSLRLSISHTFFDRVSRFDTNRNMKFSTLATTFVVLMSQASIGQAFVAPSPKNRAPATAANRVRPDGVSPKDKKKGDSGAKLAIAEKHASRRKKWGRDMDEDEEYWARKDIHTLGNMGFFGALHAAMAPISTAMIDKLAYDGVDIRLQVADELASMLHLNQGRILDLCCGVGMSTRALQDAFPNAEQVVGVDTSKEMIAMARAINIQDSVVKPFTDSVRSALKRLDNNLQRQFNSMHHKSTKITEAAQHKAMEITAAASNEIIKACGRHTSFATENAEHTHFESNSFDLITIMYVCLP